MTLRRFLITLVALFASLALSAQHYNVTVKLEDASSGDPVGFATVSLTPEKGNVKYALSDHDGKAVVEKVRVGKYTFKAEIMGYKPFSQLVEVKEALDLGVIKMELDQEVLDAASVTATGNPIIIKKDTVEYNASSFKTTDTDMLVNLLKKLPGIEVDDNGTITANGETITKITIDGKTFFLDDPQLASQNLPAKMIEKVKVVKKKSEQAEFTGIDDGNEETIIDLSVQKNMMNGLFGNVTGGAGHDVPSKENELNDWRFNGNAMVGRFTDSSQLSFIGNANNGAGGMGFTNMGGNMMGQMMGCGRGFGGFGGGFGGGITTSWMGGVNAAYDLLDRKMELSGNYMYSGSQTNSRQETYKETYLPDGSVQIQDTQDENGNPTNYSSSLRANDGHRVGVRLDHKFSDNTSILFQPQFNYSNGSYDQSQVFDTWTERNGDRSHTNQGFSKNYGRNNNWQTNGFLLFRQRLGIPGRTVSVNMNWNLSNNHSDGYNQSVTQTFAGAPAALVNQRVDQSSRTRSAGARLVYTEPLGGGFYVEGSYNYNYSLSNSVKDVFNNDGAYKYDVEAHTMEYVKDGKKDQAYSNTILNRNISQSAGVALMYQEGDVRAQLGVSLNPQNQHNETNGKPYDNKVRNWAPRAMLFYDFNENSNIRVFYNGRSGQPSTSQLMPVLDNSNPLSMALGNPDLKPYFNHNGRLEWEYTNKETFFTARLNMQGGLAQNPIVNASWYDETGRQYSFPVNGRNTYNGSARIMVNAPIAKSNFSISNNANISYSKSSSYVGKSTLDMEGYWKNAEKTSFDYDKFLKDYPDMEDADDFIPNTTQSLSVRERLRLNYRSDDLELTVNGGTRFSKPWYSIKKEGTDENITWNNSVGASVNWTIGYTGLQFTTDANYNWYNGYKTDQPSRLIWNAGLSMPVIYNSATISLNAYDILGQRRSLSTSETENYYQETRSLSIGRYIMLSFTWRFGTFGGRNGSMGGFGRGMGGFGRGMGGFGGGRGMGGGFRPF